MRSGTIMELEKKMAVVLTDDCDFVKISLKEGMDLGQRVFVEEDLTGKHFSRMNKNLMGILIAACVMIGILGIYFKLTPVFAEPYAYISVDINPSIELAIDQEYRVITWNAFNADGKSVLGKLQLKGASIDEALKGIVNEARVQGYFKNYEVGSVLLTATPNVNYDDFSKHEKQVTEDLTKLVKKEEETIENIEESNVNITTETLTPEVREKAKKKNISAGRQYLMNNAKKSRTKDLTEKDIEKANITELLNAHGNQVLGEDAFKDYKTDDNTFMEKKRKKDKGDRKGKTEIEINESEWENQEEDLKDTKIREKDRAKDKTPKERTDENKSDKIKENREKKDKDKNEKENNNKVKKDKVRNDKVENQESDEDKDKNKDRIKDQDKGKQDIQERIKDNGKDKDKDKNKDKDKSKDKNKDKDKSKNRIKVKRQSSSS